MIIFIDTYKEFNEARKSKNLDNLNDSDWVCYKENRYSSTRIEYFFINKILGTVDILQYSDDSDYKIYANSLRAGEVNSKNILALADLIEQFNTINIIKDILE